MHKNRHHKHFDHPVSTAALLITIGIIFGDIGTSPLYVLKAIFSVGPIVPSVVLGSISAIFWTLTLQTTIKYVLITLNADNKGEGGIFSLFSLVRRISGKYLVFPAVVGGCALLADGFITPAISVSSAVEGLRAIPGLHDLNTVPIVIAIISVLFVLQQFGTKKIGKFFGPMMALWFLMLAFFGGISILQTPGILHAFDPRYALSLLTQYPGGFWLLGAVFLCTTGAEALYSDLGHCGKTNIRITWFFVKICLLLNYWGQGAWLLRHHDESLGAHNPFFALMPHWFLPLGIIMATLAAIIASQALISGSFTLINEAMRLGFWFKAKIEYPTELRGQVYIPSVNWLLWVGCMGIVLIFRDSAHMEAAYGLAIVVTMMMTTTLLSQYLLRIRTPLWGVISVTATFLVIETAFLVANSKKFALGGWVTILVTSIFTVIMLIFYNARKIVSQHVSLVPLNDHLQMLIELSQDLSVPKFSTHLVYLTRSNQENWVESRVIHSIFNKRPKRADIYWFIHLNVTDDPYRMDYQVTQVAPGDVIRVEFWLGFRVAPRINLLFRKVVEDMVKNKEVDITSRYASLSKANMIGDFRFVIIDPLLVLEQDIPFWDRNILEAYFFLKKFCISDEKAFGLDASSVVIERVPLMDTSTQHLVINRIS